MIHVTDRAHIDVRLGALKDFFAHERSSCEHPAMEKPI
jgi:hypothetical protein